MSRVQPRVATHWEILLRLRVGEGRNTMLRNPNDRHVLAAAIHGRADVIVTYNLTDFPDKELWKYGITFQQPDELLLHLFNLAPSLVCSAARTHRVRLKHPPKTTAEYLETLERQSLTQFIAALRSYAAHL